MIDQGGAEPSSNVVDLSFERIARQKESVEMTYASIQAAISEVERELTALGQAAFADPGRRAIWQDTMVERLFKLKAVADQFYARISKRPTV